MSLCLLGSSAAHALLEVDVGYAGILSNSGSGNWAVPNATYTGVYGLEGDVRVDVPASGVNFGLRYSNMGLNVTNNGQTLILNNTSMSALLGYRLINTVLLLGPVFTYGLFNTGTLENTLASTGTTVATAGSVTQYTAGIEAGIKLPILLAAELGYGNLTMSGFNNSQTYLGSSTNVSLGGTYARISVGFSL